MCRKESLKHFLERTTPLGIIARHRKSKRLERKYIQWQRQGSILPMVHFGKQKVLIEYVQRFKPAVFIETGTYKGDMVYAALEQFDEIFSVELDNSLFEKAKKRFAGYRHVHILHGQSGEVLPEILRHITRSCLFWLDAHYSGSCTAKGEFETPIIQELQSILNHPIAEKHVLLIDDARDFTGSNNYPTLKELEHFIRGVHPNWLFEVEDDIIRTYSDVIVQYT